MNWFDYTKQLDEGLHLSLKAFSEWRRLFSAGLRAKPPETLQFPVNDICNSRCVMCNIWKNRKTDEISSKQLKEILLDPFMQRIRFVGISGGEPTLRKDLSDLVRVMCETLPKLEVIHIISNGIGHKKVISSLVELYRITDSYGVDFHINLSLDGIGEIHDIHRGRKGNFEDTVFVLDALRNKGIKVGVGCTITPLNCYFVDDVLLWTKKRNINPVNFRLGVPIKRLYNEDLGLLGQFSGSQRFHLAMFFGKMLEDPDTNSLRKQVYRSLIGYLLYGAQRQAGCQWQDEGLTLDSRGSLSFCSVASSTIGKAERGMIRKTVINGLPERQRILSECCKDCHHDLIGKLPPKVLWEQGKLKIWEPWKQDFASIHKWISNHKLLQIPSGLKPRSQLPSKWRSVLVTGWYGTETAGDKAILGELLHFLENNLKQDTRIYLSALNPIVCEQTLKELSKSRVEVIDVQESLRRRLCAKVDAVIIGGGPLFPISPLSYIHEQFVQAASGCVARILFGCGVGPLISGSSHELEQILKLATGGFFRDSESLEIAEGFGCQKVTMVGCDPALAYFNRWICDEENRDSESASSVLDEGAPCAVLLRENTREYVNEIENNVKELNQGFLASIVRAFDSLTDKHENTFQLLPMHCLHLGGDDRMFSRAIEEKLDRPHWLKIYREYLTLHDLINAVARCGVGVAMRFHGHVLLQALEIPYISINYSGNSGKISAFVNSTGMEDYSIDWINFDSEVFSSKFQQIILQKKTIKRQMKQRNEKMLKMLSTAYGALLAGS